MPSDGRIVGESTAGFADSGPGGVGWESKPASGSGAGACGDSNVTLPGREPRGRERAAKAGHPARHQEAMDQLVIGACRELESSPPRRFRPFTQKVAAGRASKTPV
jgi:hypothetical protein